MIDFQEQINHFNAMLIDATQSMNITDLQLDESGKCGFSNHNSPTILIYLGNGGLTCNLFCFVWEAIEQMETQDFLEILKWNHSGTMVKGAKIGFCDQFKKITMKIEFDIRVIDAIHLHNAILNFSESTITVRDYLSKVLATKKAKSSDNTITENELQDSDALLKELMQSGNAIIV